MSQEKDFRGFSPRWNIPIKLRNDTNAALNTSAVLLVVDTKREKELDFGNGFDNQVLGESMLMASNAALNYLNVSSENKEMVEVYINILSIMKTISAASGKELEIASVGGDDLAFRLSSLFESS